MVVEKRGELKNKLIVGAVLIEDKDDYLPSRGWEIVYHALDLNSAQISSLPSTVLDSCSTPYMAAVGSRLFLLGAGKSIVSGGKRIKSKKKKKNQNQNQGLSSSHFLDLSKPQNGWRLAAAGVDQLPPMDTIAFRGKVYAFFCNSESPFISLVFDPQLNQWRRLESPPFPPGVGDEAVNVDRPNLISPVMADFKNNRIIAYFEDISTASMYAYYPCEDRWRCVVEDLEEGWCRGGEPVTLADDGVIYVHNPTIKAFFRAYDTVTKAWLTVRLSSEAQPQSYSQYYGYRTLIHRGNGLLCLLDSGSGSLDFDSFVHVVQFKVELVKITDHKEVLVTPLSSQYYHFRPRCSPFLYLPV